MNITKKEILRRMAAGKRLGLCGGVYRLSDTGVGGEKVHSGHAGALIRSGKLVFTERVSMSNVYDLHPDLTKEIEL